MLASVSGCLQDDAKRLAEQRQALEEARSKWTTESAAREAQLADREQAAGVAGRQRDAEQRRRQAQEEQVHCSLGLHVHVHVHVHGDQMEKVERCMAYVHLKLLTQPC